MGVTFGLSTEQVSRLCSVYGAELVMIYSQFSRRGSVLFVELLLHDFYGGLRSPFKEAAGIKQVLLRVETISAIQIAQLALTFPNDSDGQLPPIFNK